MTWGTLFLGIYGLARGHGFPIALTPTYLGSLVYLAVVASVIGFLAYLSLVAGSEPTAPPIRRCCSR